MPTPRVSRGISRMIGGRNLPVSSRRNSSWRPNSTSISSSGSMSMRNQSSSDSISLDLGDLEMAPVQENLKQSVFDDHRLTSFARGESEVEELTFRIEERNELRVKVTPDVTNRLLKTCRQIAKEKGYCKPYTKLRLNDLIKFRDQVQRERDKPHRLVDLWKLLGFRCQTEQLLMLLNMAVEKVMVQEGGDAGWFYFCDFQIYCTQTIARLPWMRSSMAISMMAFLLFYALSPIFFCLIVRDEGVCPSDPNGNKSYYGWVTALYFASVTLSTVGYGDITVTKESPWHVFAGIVYMIICNVMIIIVFSSAAESAGPGFFFTRVNYWILNKVWGKNENELLSSKIRRITFLRLSQIVCTFTLLNLIGVAASRLFMANAQVEEEKWDWMTSVYWAVQTTTTIGYGDLPMTYNMRWFQMFYLILATYFVGNTLGGLASLKDEVHEIQRYEAWNRRELSKGLIDELQPYEHDEKIDQYEFVLASLVTLGKATYEDVVPIMDKFRSMARDDGFIIVEDEEEWSDPDVGVESFRSCHSKSSNAAESINGETCEKFEPMRFD